MRGFALLLMLANVAFFTWQQSWLPWLPWQPAQFKPSPLLLPAADVPQLVLLNEQKTNNIVTDSTIEEKTPSSTEQTLPESSPEISPTSEEAEEVKEPPTPSETKVTDLPAENATSSVVPPVEVEKEEAKEPPVVTEKKSSDTQQVTPEPNETAPDETTTSEESQTLDNLSATPSTPIPSPKEENKQSLSSTTKVGTKPANKTVGTCLQMGAYTQRKKVEGAVNWWKNKKDVTATVQSRQIQTLVATWVYLPSFKTQAEARKAQRRLAQQGIVDHMVINGGNFNNAISLGLYQDQLSVKRRLKELKNKGYNNVKTEKRYKSSTNYWLAVTILKGQSSELLASFRKVFKGHPPASVIKCESLAHD